MSRDPRIAALGSDSQSWLASLAWSLPVSSVLSLIRKHYNREECYQSTSMSRQILLQTSPHRTAPQSPISVSVAAPSSVRTRCRARRGPAPGASAATREVVRVRWLDTCWEGGGVSVGPVVGGVEPHCTRSSASTSRYRRGAASRLGGDERASSQQPTPMSDPHAT